MLSYVIGSSIVISRGLLFELSHLDAGHCISKQSHVLRIDEVLRFLLDLVNDSSSNDELGFGLEDAKNTWGCGCYDSNEGVIAN